jgi:dihydroxyacetone kinase-like protein
MKEQMSQPEKTAALGNTPADDVECKRRLIGAIARGVIAHAAELSALDAAIGDGDHGHNMKRGFEAVLQDLDVLSAQSWPELLKGVGSRLVAKIGGASGPLYGTLFLALGKEMHTHPSREDVVGALRAAVAAVKARGKSDVGQKTMLDVLVPVAQAFAEGADLSHISTAAIQAAAATIPMKAIRGRASFLGDRSIGHMDPGARSSSLMIAILCVELGEI